MILILGGRKHEEKRAKKKLKMILPLGVMEKKKQKKLKFKMILSLRHGKGERAGNNENKLTNTTPNSNIY
jgi:hypothetical protein